MENKKEYADFITSFNYALRQSGIVMSIEFSISESINLLPKRINSVYKIEGWFSRSNAWIIFDKVRYLNGVGFVSNTSILDKKQPISISSPSFDKIKEVAIFIKELLQK